jgi:Nif-specific regulatory protein
LFGHEKGSFTGATATRIGKFELAGGGTIFLDEIGDMPLDLQSKLLRVLQEKVIHRVGANKEIDTDVRIISATNKNLEQAVNNAEFRLDLFYRLNVVSISLPPLRSRKEDIRLLALHFLNRENQRYARNVILSPEAMDLLETYQWPGNIRQLENVIERAVIMSYQDALSVAQLEAILSEEANISIDFNSRYNRPAPHGAPGSNYANTPIRGYLRVKENDGPRIVDAVNQTNGNKTAAAKLLGMTPRQLHYRLKKLAIELD